MRAIFEKAWGVYAWLGLEAEDGDLAMTTVKDIASRCRKLPGPGDSGFAQGGVDTLARDVFDGPNHKKNPLWISNANLMQRRWWPRLWTSLEATAKDYQRTFLICGAKMIDMEDFILFYSLAEQAIMAYAQADRGIWSFWVPPPPLATAFTKLTD